MTDRPKTTPIQWLWGCETAYETFWGLRVGSFLVGVLQSKVRANAR